jgi:hypothetical protein
VDPDEMEEKDRMLMAVDMLSQSLDSTSWNFKYYCYMAGRDFFRQGYKSERFQHTFDDPKCKEQVLSLMRFYDSNFEELRSSTLCFLWIAKHHLKLPKDIAVKIARENFVSMNRGIEEDGWWEARYNYFVAQQDLDNSKEKKKCTVQ